MAAAGNDFRFARALRPGADVLRMHEGAEFIELAVNRQHRAMHLFQGRIQPVMRERRAQPGVHPGRQHPGRLVAMVASKALQLAGLGKVVARRTDALQRAVFDKALGRFGNQRLGRNPLSQLIE